MAEPVELSRVRRRPRPLRELDQRAKSARLQLERELYRPRLVRLDLRVPPEMLERLDAERRVAHFGIPSRNAMF